MIRNNKSVHVSAVVAILPFMSPTCSKRITDWITWRLAHSSSVCFCFMFKKMQIKSKFLHWKFYWFRHPDDANIVTVIIYLSWGKQKIILHKLLLYSVSLPPDSDVSTQAQLVSECAHCLFSVRESLCAIPLRFSAAFCKSAICYVTARRKRNNNNNNNVEFLNGV